MAQGLRDIVEIRNASRAGQSDTAIQPLQFADLLPELSKLVGDAPPPEVYYIRQVTGKIDGRGVVGYFNPEFAYLFDAGHPRMPLAVLPYELPGVRDNAGNFIPAGRGDAEFPDWRKVRMFSAASRAPNDLLYPAPVGVLMIGAKEGVTEAQLRQALSPYVKDLVNEGSYYTAKVEAFHETEAAARIEHEVAAVRYAQVSFMVRDNSAPWLIDRIT